VYRINPNIKTTSVEYFDDGKQISAGSTALRFKNDLYVSGVFDPKIVRKNYSENITSQMISRCRKSVLPRKLNRLKSPPKEKERNYKPIY
jgi:hypothetical protein